MTPSHQKPPLRALQIFEAATRLGGFTAAGRELGITQSAVSRQIADLESTLGVSLFVRRGARVSPTPSGRRLADRLAAALGEMRLAVTEVVRSDAVVTLSMLPSVAAKWFAPRLATFGRAHPGIDLRITASRHLVDFMAEGVDAAIRYGPGPYPDLSAQKIAHETIAPVCTPDYAKRLGLREPADLKRAALLHGDIMESWAEWFRMAGCDHDVPAGPHLGDDAAMLQATLDHQGVALGRSQLVGGDLETGRLTAPFGTKLIASYAYWFIRPQAPEPDANLRAVEAWVVSEFEETKCFV